jgi:large subunit ribosomal protein L24
MPSHVRKGDTVMITSGDHKGRVGEVIRVIPSKSQVLIKGVNLRTKHVRPTRTNPRGGIFTKEAPLHISKVSPVVDGKPTRVRFTLRDDGSKVRVAARGGKVLGQVRGPRTGASKAETPKTKAPRTKAPKTEAGV